MKRKSLLLVLVMGMCLGPSGSEADEAKPPLRTISVSGTASVKVVPDEVVLVVGIETVNEKLDAAREEVNAGIKKAMAVLSGLEIDAKDVQTDRLEMRPEYRASREWEWQRKQVAYFVSNRLSLTLRDVSKCEALISSLLEAGINTISDVDFRTSTLREHRDRARLMAIRAAKEKAALMAGELGMKVGKPVSVTEEYAAPYFYGWGRRNYAQQQNVAVAEPSGPTDEDGAVALGQISVSANVRVTFELE